MPSLLEYLDRNWNFKNFNDILWITSNLPTSVDDQQILASNFYHSLTQTHFANKSDLENLVHAMLNLLTPFLSESYVLGYFECEKSLVQCLGQCKHKYFEVVLDLVQAYLLLDNEFCLEGEESYEFKFEDAGIVEVLLRYDGPLESRHRVESLIQQFEGREDCFD